MKTGMKILFITHKAERCGVADYGRRLFAILQPHMDIDLCETDKPVHYAFYDIVLYNYHYATLPFVDTHNQSVKHIALFHEAHLNFSPDVVINVSDLPRPLFENYFPGIVSYLESNDIPVIGSFGFGFPDKNFPGLCQLVKDQFDTAVIRLNIPFAEFGDKDGNSARLEVEKCKTILKDSNITLQVNHEYLSQIDLLQWLNRNDINLFLYHNSHGRGLSSAIDYALSVKKPIGVSSSEMFRHLPKCICVDNISIPELIKSGIGPLKDVYIENSNYKLVEKIKSYL